MKNKILLGVLFVAQGFFSAAFTSGHLSKRLRHFIEALEPEIPALQGIGVAVLYNGRIFYKANSGFRHDFDGPIDFDTLFPLASVSKSVTATAIALEVDKGRVNLEKRLRLPWLRPAVNLKQVLSHTTGYQFTGNIQIERGMSRAAVLKTLKKQRAVYRPGCVHFYSNILFSLVDEMLERQYTSLAAAISELQFKLGTDGIQILPLNPNFKVAYPHSRASVGCGKQRARAQALRFPPYYPKTVPAAAGVFASLDGMIELLKLWCGHRPDLVSSRTLRRFYSPRVSTNDARRLRCKIPRSKGKIKSYYGLGWRILKASKYPDKDFVFHTGYIAGINTFIGFIPSEDVGIVILVNEDNGFTRTWGMRFWAELLQ